MRNPGAGLEPNPFCETLPWQPKIFDNSWLQQLMHCPRHFYYGTILGLRLRLSPGQPAPIDLSFGTLIHDGNDLFTKARAAGLDAEAATGAALGYALESSWLVGEPADVFGGTYGHVWQCPDRTRTVTKKGIVRCPWSYAEHLDTLAAGEGPNWVCPGCQRPVALRLSYLCTDKIKNRRTLARSIVALCDHITASSVQPLRMPDGRIGSEYRWFRELSIPSPDGPPYLMTGSFDGVASAPGVPVLAPEYKTTRRNPDDSYFASLSMSPQVYTYGWALDGEFGRGARVLLCVLHVQAGGTEIHPRMVYLNPESLAEWQAEMEHYVQEGEVRARLAASLAADGKDPSAAYPRRLTACSGLPGAPTTPCPFRDYCRLAPSDRAGFLAANFAEDRSFTPLTTKGVARTQ